MSVRSAPPWSDGGCTASSMLRPGLRMTPTVTAPRPSGARQGPAQRKRRQGSHSLRPCPARQGEDSTAQRADAGNQQGQCVDGGESASSPWRTLCRTPVCMAWTTRLQRACSHSTVRHCACAPAGVGRGPRWPQRGRTTSKGRRVWSAVATPAPQGVPQQKFLESLTSQDVDDATASPLLIVIRV